MEYCLNELFPVIIYILSSILLVALIVLTIKVIHTIKKVDKVVDDIDTKSKKLNGVFDMVDNAADTLAVISDKMVGFVVNGITSLFSRKNKKENEENE